ncbi:MAG: hypothetical protein ACE5GD_02275 [Candidatus Geothermarchaeales archaeon]
MSESDKKIKIILKNPYFRNLLKNSHLTENQLITLLIWKNKRIMGEKILNSKGKVRILKKRVSKGSFYRSVTQARTNLRRSIITLMVVSMLQIIDVEALSALINITNFIIKEGISPNGALIDKILRDLRKI